MQLHKKKGIWSQKMPEKKSSVFYPGAKHRCCGDEHINSVLKRK